MNRVAITTVLGLTLLSAPLWTHAQTSSSGSGTAHTTGNQSGTHSGYSPGVSSGKEESGSTSSGTSSSGTTSSGTMSSGAAGGSTTGTAPQTTESGQLNSTDHTFLKTAAMSGMTEVELARIAEQKAKNDSVKQFARRMIEDHTKLNDRITQFAQQHHIDLPKQPDHEHTAMREKLEKASANSFDEQWVSDMIREHQKDAQLFEHEISAGQDSQLKTIAQEALPIIQQHLEQARSLHGQISSRR